MTLTDWIGFLGVTILLIAFFMNMRGIIKNDGIMYLILNTVGAGIACVASILLNYWPFIILEGCWTIVSIYGIITFLMNKKA